MPPLTDPVRCRCYRAALANWRYAGYVNFGKDASRWLGVELREYTHGQLAQLLTNTFGRSWIAVAWTSSARRGLNGSNTSSITTFGCGSTAD